MSRRTLVILAVLAALAGGLVLSLAAAGWWYWSTSPTYSLTRVQDAINTHDLALFEKHVDVEGVTNSFVEAMLQESVQGDKPSNDPWERAGQALGAGLVKLMRPKLAEEARRNVRRFVETGRVDDKPAPPGTQSPPPYAAIGAVEEVDKQGKVAVVTLRAQRPDGKGPLPLKVRMRDMGGYWQVTEIVNARDVVRAMNEAPSSR